MNAVLFYASAALLVGGALTAVSARNLFRAVLGLAVALFSTAFLFLLLSAEILAAVQVILYVGGVIVLIIFAVMLMRRTRGKRLVDRPRNPLLAALVSAAVFAALLVVVSPFKGSFDAPPPDISSIGGALAASPLPFELISLLLIGAVIGAIVLLRR